MVGTPRARSMSQGFRGVNPNKGHTLWPHRGRGGRYFAELRASSNEPRPSIAKAIPRIQYMLS